MRKLESKETHEKRQKRNQIIIGVILVGLMALSPLGFSLLSGDPEDNSKVTENGLTFYKNGNVWSTVIGDKVFNFENLPSEVNDISINGSLDIGGYVGLPLYIVNPTISAGSILSNLQDYPLRYQQACLNGTNCTGDLPIKGCDENVLIFEESENESINVEGSCVFIKGYGSRIADAFVYEVLNIN